jgi:hypothetical protein
VIPLMPYSLINCGCTTGGRRPDLSRSGTQWPNPYCRSDVLSAVIKYIPVGVISSRRTLKPTAPDNSLTSARIPRSSNFAPSPPGLNESSVRCAQCVVYGDAHRQKLRLAREWHTVCRKRHSVALWGRC